jgi:hypothetical protein
LIDIPRGLRNSSFSTSPGWAVTRLGVAIALVVVDDFDIGGPFLSPDETDAPLVIDPDGVLATTAFRRNWLLCRKRNGALFLVACGDPRHREPTDSRAQPSQRRLSGRAEHAISKRYRLSQFAELIGSAVCSLCGSGCRASVWPCWLLSNIRAKAFATKCC